MNYDSLNSETFGEASAGDWRVGHEAYVRSSSSGPDSTDDEALSDGLTQQLKGLWPTSPGGQSSLPNIWSSPELPHRHTQRGDVIGSPTIPVGGRVLTVEELEQHVSPLETPPTQRPLRPPPGIRMPQLPPHPLMGHNQRMGLPPPFLMRGGLPPQRYPMYMRPPPPMFQHPPHHRVLLPPSAFHHHPPPQQQYRWPPQQHSEMMPVRRSRRSEYLGEMKSDGSGFMTQREKEWVIKIQLIQLQSSDPAKEDYYYMNYIKRKQEGRQTTSYESNEGLALPTVEHEDRKYTPTEFTGALGKLSVSSLGAPRRRIDVGVAGGEAGMEITRKKTAIIIIEKLFPQLLELEELDKKYQVAMDTELRANILTVLQVKTHSSKSELALFYQILAVRKGKRLIKRLLPLLTDEQGQWILCAVLQNLPSIVRRDTTDQVLPEWTPCVSHLLSKLPLSSLNTCLHALLEGGTTGLGKVAQTQFGARLLNELLTKGHAQPNHQKTDKETWHQLSGHLMTALTPHRDHMTSQQPHIVALLQTLDNTSL
ncbi:protein PAT1 homolog 1-like isoform X2 [Halichondria panicea]|uniref:protein PAT1 homolog 1-like isoform X2 n=1 Tax=Halichondria panicea TaxID=6063 RepID=UPI00312BBF4B